MEAQHVTIATVERMALCSSDEDRACAAACVARVCARHAPLFCASDDHLHAVVLVDRGRAGRLAAWLSHSLRDTLGARLQPARIRPVEGRRHLHNLVRYVLDQTDHHELSTACHPALWPGSSFQDLVGARLLRGFDSTLLREALPRVRLAEVFAAVRLPVVEPVRDPLELHIRDWVVAAEAAVGVPLRGRNATAAVARRLVAAWARAQGLPSGLAAEHLRCTARAVRFAWREPVDERLARAAAMQLAIRQAVLRPQLASTR